MGGAVWDYQDKVAIVTGASLGIGKAIAERLVESGAKVVAAARTASTLEALCAELGDAAYPVQTDITIVEEIERLVRLTVEKFGRLDVAFNVAGGARRGTVLDVTEEDWDYTNRLTLRGALFCMKYQAKQMVAQGMGGAIVNISSVNSLTPLPGAIAYPPHKAGINMLTKSAAVELAEHRIRVNALLPGLTITPGTEWLNAAPGIKGAFFARIPMGRAAEPSEMTGPALFLGSSEASYITGATLVADGAWTLTSFPELSKLGG